MTTVTTATEYRSERIPALAPSGRLNFAERGNLPLASQGRRGDLKLPVGRKRALYLSDSPDFRYSTKTSSASA